MIVEGLRGLEELCLDRETLALREELGVRFARIVYDGRWFTFVRTAISAAAEEIAGRLTGEVAVRLFKGGCVTVKRKSPFSLYSEDFATFGADEVYNQKHAEGFIRLLTLPERIAAFNGFKIAENKKSALVDQRGVAPVVGPRTGPVVEPKDSPVDDPIIKEGKAV